jgi:hypothetical protein
MALPLDYWTLRRKRKSLQKVFTKIGRLDHSDRVRPLERLEIETDNVEKESFKMFFKRTESENK